MTFDQLYFMFEEADREEYDRRRFLAAIQGIDIDKEAVSANQTATTNPVKTTFSQPTGPESRFLFKDPSEYASMSKEERAEKTAKMQVFWAPLAEKKL